MVSQGLPDKLSLCSIWSRLQCVLKQDYRDVVDKLLSGAAPDSVMDAIKPTLNACVQEEMRKCSVSYADEKSEWLDFYGKIVSLFNALAVLMDPPKFSFIIENMFDLSDVSVAELKGLLDKLCEER